MSKKTYIKNPSNTKSIKYLAFFYFVSERRSVEIVEYYSNIMSLS